MNEKLQEEGFLRDYSTSIYKNPAVSVDIVIFSILNNTLQVLTVKRDEPPFLNHWSLVGGFVDMEKDQDIEACAKRKLKEKTSVDTPYLEQLTTIGNHLRDPRGWSVTVVYFALIPCDTITLKTGGNVSEIKWQPVQSHSNNLKLAFDHDKILAASLSRLRAKVLNTSLPVHFMPELFSLRDLQKIYELVLGKQLEHKSFRRRILSADFLIKSDQMRNEGHRPAQLYSLKPNHQSYHFVRKLESVNNACLV